jgi:hypothetical protein
MLYAIPPTLLPYSHTTLLPFHLPTYSPTHLLTYYPTTLDAAVVAAEAELSLHEHNLTAELQQQGRGRLLQQVLMESSSALERENEDLDGVVARCR